MSSGIWLACPQGNASGSHPLAHRLTIGQAEAAFYALSGDHLTAQLEPQSTYPEPEEECPLELCSTYLDPEMYSEHVHARREQRLHAQRERSTRP